MTPALNMSPEPMRVSSSVGTIVIALLILPACSDPDQPTTDGGTVDGGTTQCASGLRAVGPACVPIFDECKGGEIPVLGGGCRRVGPPKTCLTGWALVKGGWCEPILPKTKCPAGTMEVIGKAICQPIGDCGSGKWGKIKTTSSTIFVDQTYSGSNADGSQARPYTTIGAALEAATAGTHIAVAAGTYKEDVSIERKVTLEGRCAQKVTIASQGTSPAVEMKWWANGAILRGVTISGSAAGLNVDGVGVTVERVAVQGCEGLGVVVDFGGTLTLRDSLVAGNRTMGIDLYSSKTTLERSVVRDTHERASDKQYGTGFQSAVQSGHSLGSELILRDSLVASNRTAGISIYSSKATVERSVVRDTRERASDMQLGTGICAFVQPGQSRGSELVLRDSLVAGNRNEGVALFSSKATVERSVVRDTRKQASDKLWGTGIGAFVDPGQSQGSELTLRDSLVANNREVGIYMASSKVTVKRSVVRDTRERTSDLQFGTGIQAFVQPGQSRGSELELYDSLVAGNRNVGILLLSSKATIQCSAVRGTRELASNKKGGTGIEAQVQSDQSWGAELTLRDSLVAGNRNAGVLLSGSNGTIARCVISDTRKDGLNRFGDGVIAVKKATLKVQGTTVEGSARAGFLFSDSGGSVHRSLIRHNVFAIDLENSARPTIGKDNKIMDNKENEISSRGLNIPAMAKSQVSPKSP